jgi:hypothetical protein
VRNIKNCTESGVGLQRRTTGNWTVWTGTTMGNLKKLDCVLVRTAFESLKAGLRLS